MIKSAQVLLVVAHAQARTHKLTHIRRDLITLGVFFLCTWNLKNCIVSFIFMLNILRRVCPTFTFYWKWMKKMDERNPGQQREVKDSRQMEEKWQEVQAEQ